LCPLNELPELTMSKLDRELLDASIEAMLQFSQGESITHPGSLNQREKIALDKGGKGRNYDHGTGKSKAKKEIFWRPWNFKLR